MSDDDDRKDPRRLLNRAEAVRRPIHAAVRMFAMGEDPFALHLLIQSADKLLIDIAKKQGVDLAFDWEIFIKEEHRSEFFAMYRETYNFFKHANRGPENLPVYDIAAMNASQLTIAIENYATLFGAFTAHSRQEAIAVSLKYPAYRHQLPLPSMFLHLAAPNE